jgi:hypothetical protein
MGIVMKRLSKSNMVGQGALGLALLFIASSCSTSYYVPNVRNVPTFNGSKELQATGFYQITMPDFTTGYNGQLAYSINNNLGIMANYIHSRNKDNTTPLIGNYGEIGIGYFKRVDNLYYDCFVGGGIGNGTGVNKNYGFLSGLFFGGRPPEASIEPDYRIDASYNRFFIQPSLAYTLGKRLTASFALRVDLLHFNNIVINKTTNEETVLSHMPVYYWGPASMLILSINKNLKFTQQVGFNVSKDSQSNGENKFYFSLGVRYSFDLKK